jgi:transcriptional regulator with XRE-family HTH domain
MYNLNKKEKLNFVLEKCKELSISAYEIAKNTDLTEAGIIRILNGTSKNPHENTLNTIILFLEKKVLGKNISENIHIIEEEKTEYQITDYSKEFINCLEERNRLTKEVIKLQILLTKNNIEFKNILEEEN